MSQPFEPGDFLVYQLESGYGLIRILDVERGEHGDVWHISVYQELFPDVETAENSLNEPATLHQDKSHLALTDRAFERTPTAKLKNISLEESDLTGYRDWMSSPDRQVFDRSLLLLLGMR
jgi:hypothetical protein